MTKVIEAIYSNGHLEPVEPLDLKENQRVTLTLQTHESHDPAKRKEKVGDPTSGDRRAARQRLVDFLTGSPLHIQGPLPSREELYDDRV